MRPILNMDVGWFMLAFLLSLVWEHRTAMFQLSGFYHEGACNRPKSGLGVLMDLSTAFEEFRAST